MAVVETVQGPVDVDALGPTLMHEHVFVLTPDVMQNYGNQWWDEEERVADAIAKLTAVKALGIETIVDPTVVGLGRDIRMAMPTVSCSPTTPSAPWTSSQAKRGRHALATVTPNWHFRHISEDVLPALRAEGVTAEQITTMMVDNPRRYFS